jgi:small subunit ribosomal protein S7e
LSRFPCSRAGTRPSSGAYIVTPFTQATADNFSLTRELEKKFSDRHVLIVASRRILPRPKRSNRSRSSQTQKRPRSRTLTAVHDAILTDLVYPVEIVGKRLRTREDGSKMLKVVLDEKERGGVDYRLDTYSEVYKRLTGKGVNFEFPQSASTDY